MLYLLALLLLRFQLVLLWLHVLLGTCLVLLVLHLLLVLLRLLVPLELPVLLQQPVLPGLLLVHEFLAPGQCQWFLMRFFLLSHVFQLGPVLLALLWLLVLLGLLLLRLLGLPGLHLVITRLLVLPGLLLVSKVWAPGQCQWFLMRFFLLFHDFQGEPEACCLPSLWGSDQGLQADWLLVLLVLQVQLVLRWGAHHCLSYCRVMGSRG